MLKAAKIRIPNLWVDSKLGYLGPELGFLDGGEGGSEGGGGWILVGDPELGERRAEIGKVGMNFDRKALGFGF